MDLKKRAKHTNPAAKRIIVSITREFDGKTPN
jgi:hypothetical protein